MTNEQILELASYYDIEEDFVEYDRLGFEVISLSASKEDFLEFARAIRKKTIEEVLTLLKDVPNPEANKTAINRIMSMNND
jgi:hypothetical protein